MMLVLQRTGRFLGWRASILILGFDTAGDAWQQKVKEGCSLYIINWNTQADIFITGVAAKPNFYWVFTLSIDQYLFYLMLQNPEVTNFQAEKSSETKLVYCKRFVSFWDIFSNLRSCILLNVLFQDIQFFFVSRKCRYMFKHLKVWNFFFLAIGQ